MFNRVIIIVVVTLLEALPLMAGIVFKGGDVTGKITFITAQSLSVPPGGPITTTQGLTPGDILSIETAGMTGIAAGSTSLTMDATGIIEKAFSERQAISATTLPTSSSAGLQNTGGSVTVGSSDWVNLAGRTGNIRLGSAQGADPSITFTAFTQTARHDVPAVGTSMAQSANITSTIASSGTAATPLSLIGIDEASGVVGFESSVVSDIGRRQEFGGLLAAGGGIYGGEQETQDLVIMESAMEVGTTSEE